MYTEPRPLCAIAFDISKAWARPYFGAEPYLRAMRSLDGMQDRYGFDSAESIVRYFLANASTFRGADAKRLKAELRAML